MKKILNKNFTLPSVEQRWMPEGTVKNIFYTYFDKERDDTYIYFIMLLLGATITAIFSGIYLSTYFFNYEIDLGYIRIGLSNDEPVRDFIDSFTLVVPTFLFLTVLPFGFFLFLRNVNMQTLDLLFSKGIEDWRRDNIKRFYFNLKILFFVAIIIFIFSKDAPLLILENYNYGIDFSQSITFVIHFCLIFLIVYPLLPILTVMTIFIYYQNKKKIGPYYNNTEKGI